MSPGTSTSTAKASPGRRNATSSRSRSSLWSAKRAAAPLRSAALCHRRVKGSGPRRGGTPACQICAAASHPDRVVHRSTGDGAVATVDVDEPFQFAHRHPSGSSDVDRAQLAGLDQLVDHRSRQAEHPGGFGRRYGENRRLALGCCTHTYVLTPMIFGARRDAAASGCSSRRIACHPVTSGEIRTCPVRAKFRRQALDKVREGSPRH